MTSFTEITITKGSAYIDKLRYDIGDVFQTKKCIMTSYSKQSTVENLIEELKEKYVENI